MFSSIIGSLDIVGEPKRFRTPLKSALEPIVLICWLVVWGGGGAVSLCICLVDNMVGECLRAGLRAGEVYQNMRFDAKICSQR